MKNKIFRRAGAIALTAVLGAGAAAMCAGCTTNRPEITITYNFNGKDYAVDYTLSRKTAPKTVQHFIELADAGYYDGLCIHDYTAGHLMTGGYTYENDSLVEKNYYEAVASLSLTQSVFRSDEEKTPLYSVYGEFEKNGVRLDSGSKFNHKEGALVMYYSDKGDDNTRVVTLRNDNGEYQENSEYKYNSANSLFYTYTGAANAEKDENYCVFGMADDYENQMNGENGLLTAIKSYTDSLASGAVFAEEEEFTLHAFDPFESVRSAKIKTTFHVPTVPITVKSVKVNKY